MSFALKTFKPAVASNDQIQTGVAISPIGEPTAKTNEIKVLSGTSNNQFGSTGLLKLGFTSNPSSSSGFLRSRDAGPKSAPTTAVNVPELDTASSALVVTGKGVDAEVHILGTSEALGGTAKRVATRNDKQGTTNRIGQRDQGLDQDRFVSGPAVTNLLSRNSSATSTSSIDVSRASSKAKSLASSHGHVDNKTALAVHQGNIPGYGLIQSSNAFGGCPPDDPFQEVNKVIHGQNRRIKELEAHARDQNATIESLRSKLNETQDISKQTMDSVRELKESLARAEKVTEVKQNELQAASQRIDFLETDRSRMINENQTLMKTVSTEKRKFMTELKASTQTILRLQGVCSAIGSDPLLQCTPSNPVDENHLSERLEDAEKAKVVLESRIMQLEQRLQEADDANGYVPVIVELIRQCASCSEHLNAILQSGQDAGEGPQKAVQEAT